MEKRNFLGRNILFIFFMNHYYFDIVDVDTSIITHKCNTRVSRVISRVHTPASSDHNIVHSQCEAAGPGPGTSGTEHQQKVPVNILEGDLSSDPGVSVWTGLVDVHFTRFTSVGPGQYCQHTLVSS